MMLHSPHLRCGLRLDSCLPHMHLQYSPMRKITAQSVLAVPVAQDLRGCMRACSGLGRTPEGSTAGLARLFCVGASCLITGERDGAGIGLLAVRPVPPIMCTSELLDWAALGRFSSAWGVWGCLAASAASIWSTGAGTPSCCLRILRASFLLCAGGRQSPSSASLSHTNSVLK